MLVKKKPCQIFTCSWTALKDLEHLFLTSAGKLIPQSNRLCCWVTSKAQFSCSRLGHGFKLKRNGQPYEFSSIPATLWSLPCIRKHEGRLFCKVDWGIGPAWEIKLIGTCGKLRLFAGLVFFQPGVSFCHMSGCKFCTLHLNWDLSHLFL